MTRETFAAMGTSVTVVGADREGLAAAQRRFSAAEQRLSRFLPGSELSQVNDAASHQVVVSSDFAEVLEAAAELRRRTGGLVDPAVGAALAAWGYDRTFAEIQGRNRFPDPLPEDRHEWTLRGRLLHRLPGVRLDLGGIAKGWTCDRAVEAGEACIVNAGGDVRSAEPSAEVEVVDPWGDTAFVVALGVGALATSSVSRRRWRVGASEAHHLIDPRTMEPARSPVVSATAVAATAVEAEAAAKAVLLLGAEGLAWADRCDWIRSAAVAWSDGSIYATSGLEFVA